MEQLKDKLAAVINWDEIGINPELALLITQKKNGKTSKLNKIEMSEVLEALKFYYEHKLKLDKGDNIEYKVTLKTKGPVINRITEKAFINEKRAGDFFKESRETLIKVASEIVNENTGMIESKLMIEDKEHTQMLYWVAYGEGKDLLDFDSFPF